MPREEEIGPTGNPLICVVSLSQMGRFVPHFCTTNKGREAQTTI